MSTAHIIVRVPGVLFEGETTVEEVALRAAGWTPFRLRAVRAYTMQLRGLDLDNHSFKKDLVDYVRDQAERLRVRGRYVDSSSTSRGVEEKDLIKEVKSLKDSNRDAGIGEFQEKIGESQTFVTPRSAR